MQGEQAPTPGVSSRRSACDRCRGQKLRCLREGSDPDGRCDRCSKADTQCVTSPVYHMRNYSVVGGHVVAASSSQKRRRRADPASRETTQAPTPQQQSQGQNTPPSAATESSSAPPFGWPSVDPFVPPPASDGGSSNFEAINWSSLIDPVAAPLSGSTPVPQDMPWPTYSEEAMRTPSLANLGSLDLGASNRGSTATVTGMDITQSHIEELSRINLDLASQMARMAKGPPHVNLKTIIAPDCSKANPSGAMTTPVEDLLATTRHYLDVLGLITGTSRPWLPITLNPPPTNNSGRFMSTGCSTASSALSTSASSAASSHEESQDSWSAKSPSTATQPSSAASAQSPLDTSTLLLVLLCYIHILRLHVALFAHIRVYLQFVSESEDRTINPLPGLCGFDNFPLQSGNLQATMIIHLVTSMFERIESLLGLPRELRIGTREVGHDGLLRSEGLLRLAESLIRREDTGRPEEGKGGIKSLRRDMKKAKRLLRGRIAP
ncbi:hypothetical protein OQA88_10732 [Cercophora sp. LCS_1]